MANAKDDRVSLTIKLSPQDYTMLRDFCTRRTIRLGRRYTHQQAVVDALRRVTARKGAKSKAMEVAKVPP